MLVSASITGGTRDRIFSMILMIIRAFVFDIVCDMVSNREKVYSSCIYARVYR